jgi:hypothetical protein
MVRITTLRYLTISCTCQYGGHVMLAGEIEGDVTALR